MTILYICDMKTITLETSNELADRFSKLSDKEKKDLTEMINVLIEDKRTLREVMDDMSAYAQKQGLTPALLEKLLKDE
jgi:macrodomain Ter protein organizer (MatP/YcbG family)